MSVKDSLHRIGGAAQATAEGALETVIAGTRRQKSILDATWDLESNPRHYPGVKRYELWIANIVTVIMVLVMIALALVFVVGIALWLVWSRRQEALGYIAKFLPNNLRWRILSYLMTLDRRDINVLELSWVKRTAPPRSAMLKPWLMHPNKEIRMLAIAMASNMKAAK